MGSSAERSEQCQWCSSAIPRRKGRRVKEEEGLYLLLGGPRHIRFHLTCLIASLGGIGQNNSRNSEEERENEF